jgi:lysophospholipase L1-like esterase
MSPGMEKACVQARGGLPFCFRKLPTGEKIRISFYGGAAAVGEGASRPELCYRELLPAYLRHLYPKAQAGGYDYTATGNGSWLGAFSVGKDSYYGVNDLFVLDFALDDADAPETQVCESMEGIVRQLRSRSPETEFIFLYVFSKDQMDSFRKGEVPASIRAQEKIAAHYGIPSVNAAKFVADRILAGTLSLEEFSRDGVRPTDKGHALYLEAMKPLFDQCRAAAETNTALATRALPKPLTAHPLEKAQSIFYEWCKREGRWTTGQESPSARFTHVLVSDTPGDTLTVNFKGESAGYVGVSGPDSGDVEFSVDGGEWRPHANFLPEAGSSFRVHGVLAARGLAPEANHELKLRVAGNQPKGSAGRVIRIGFVLVNGTVADPYQGLAGLPLIDTLYASMAPLRYTADPGRWAFLPRTLKRLQDGPSLRIVMLGDSIINDTADSKFDLLLGRMYPKCRIEKIASTRGSTGCNWYKAENRVQDYVIKYNPEVLIIGGSSNGDAESVREVIKQVRAKIAPEILVMTPVFGSNDKDVKDVKAIPRDIDPNGRDYRANLKRVAEEEKVEFLDMTGPWVQYIRDSGKTYGWFRRDRVHANGRGRQILGRILETYFAPKDHT